MNWIESYQKENNRLPELPQYLKKVVRGSSLSKGMGMRTPSGQYWNSLTVEERTKFRELAEWLGINPEDLLNDMKRMLPKAPRGR